MSDGIGWLFPPTGGGVKTGWNDPAITHFGGAREQGLARETIQNSLDARDGLLSEPVDVEFDLHDVDTDWFGKEALARTIEACVAEAEGDEKASTALRESASLLEQPSLKFLRIADSHTTGLRGKRWETLVKGLGTSYHESRGGPVTAGGSYGIGKSAPFAMTPLRTVFYWTRFEEGGEPRELFQGKAVLMSHEADGVVRQNVGFFGITHECRELEGADIPAEIQKTDRPPRLGTSLWIAGFPGEDGWQERIARQVAASFFGTIENRWLTVTLEPSREMADAGLITMDSEGLQEWFDYLDRDGEVEDAEEVRDARLFWELLREEPTAERQDYDLGLCRLWIRVSDSDDLPRKVGLMRNTGMLITTRQRNLIQFHGTRGFVAICRFDGDEGNALLRQMENPTHDQFEPDRIENDPKRQQQARTALRRVTSWIREEIAKHAAPPVSAEPTPLLELSRLLPDLEPEEDSFGDGVDGENEPSFGGAPRVELKPRARPAPPSVPGPGEGEDDPEGWGIEQPANGGRRNKSQKKRRQAQQGRREQIPVSDARMTQMPGYANRYQVSFTPGADGRASIDLMEAGDSQIVARDDLRIVEQDGSLSPTTTMELTAGQRVGFEITGKQPIGERAWLVRAVRVEARKS